MTYFTDRGSTLTSVLMGALYLSYFVLLIACPLLTESRLVELHCRKFNSIPMPDASVCQCLDRVHFSFLLRRKLALAGTFPYLKSPRLFLLPLCLLLCGDVELNPGPSCLILCHLNARSMTSVSVDMDKPELIQDVIVDANIDVLSVNETWLTI